MRFFTSLARRSAKTRFDSAISNAAVAAALITAILVGFADTTRAQIPTINVDKTCRAAGGATVSLMGRSTTEQDVQMCLDSEQKAREQIIKDQATYSAADKKQCIRTDVYLPSYVEWLPALKWSGTCERCGRDSHLRRTPSLCQEYARRSATSPREDQRRSRLSVLSYGCA